MVSQPKPRPWKERLLAVKKELTKLNRSAYQIAVDLTAVYDDPEFLSEMGSEEAAVEALDAYAAQLFVILPEERSPFHDLRNLLVAYPERKDWEDGRLSEMYDRMLADQAARNEAAARGVQRPKWKQLCEEALQQIAELKAENAELKAENRVLRNQLSEVASQAVLVAR